MNPYNPYEAPTSNDSAFGQGNNESAQAAIMEAMTKTRPWVLFLSVLGFLTSGFLVLLGLFAMVAGAATSAFAKGGMDKLGPLIGLVYIVLGAFYAVPSFFLWSYGSSIGNYKVTGGSIDALATAIKKQASFWRFTGIATAVMIALYVVIIVIAIVVGIAAAVSR